MRIRVATIPAGVALGPGVGESVVIGGSVSVVTAADGPPPVDRPSDGPPDPLAAASPPPNPPERTIEVAIATQTIRPIVPSAISRRPAGLFPRSLEASEAWRCRPERRRRCDSGGPSLTIAAG